MMIRPLAACLLLIVCIAGTSQPASSAAPPPPAHPAGDACGFRGAAWPYVQLSADTIAKVGKIPPQVKSGDAGFLRQALRDTILDIGSDFAWPAGWKDLRYRLGRVMVDIRQELQTLEGIDTGQAINEAAMSQARSEQQAAWRTITSMCPHHGKSTTTGRVLRYYGWNTTTIRAFGMQSAWSIAYNFDCRGNQAYGRAPSGHFLLTVLQGKNSVVATAANDQGKTGAGNQIMYEAGAFYLKVRSDCYWHLRIMEAG